MTSLIKRVQGHCTGQKTSGQNTLSLAVECIEHMRDHDNEWTALAWLIGRSEPAQSRSVRSIVGKVLQGWSLKKDEDQKSGLRFVKQKGANQGFDEAFLTKVKAQVTAKASIQSKGVKELYAKPAPVVVADAEFYAKMLASIKSRLEKAGGDWATLVAAETAKKADVQVASKAKKASPAVSPAAKAGDRTTDHVAH